jgi:hypothetical protein
MSGRVNPGGRARLESVLGHLDFRIPCDRLIKASGSIVYAWVRQGRALYVGMSGQGLFRPQAAYQRRMSTVLAGRPAARGEET